MAARRIDIERALLVGDADWHASRAEGSVQTQAVELVRLVGIGAFSEVLHSTLGAELLCPEDVTCDGAAGRAGAYLASVAPDDALFAAMAVRAVGVAALSLFAHANWMGVAVGQYHPLACASCSEAALPALQEDGENVYALIVAPALLCAARSLLVTPLDALTAADPVGFAAPWWAARCTLLHLRCLSSPAPSLERVASNAMRSALAALEACPKEDGELAQATKQPSAEGDLSGQMAVVIGLEARPELNGQRARVGDFDATKGRYAVQFDEGGSGLLLKPENLAPIAISAHNADCTEGSPPDSIGSTCIATEEEESRALAMGAKWREAVALARIELANACLVSRKPAAASVELARARAVLGVRFELRGMLGKRTKHQSEAVSQLVLCVHHASHALPRLGDELAQGLSATAALPPCILEEDEELLPAMELLEQPLAAPAAATDGAALPSSATSQPMLPVEKSLLLAECAHVQATRPMHESTNEEVESYVRAALANPVGWPESTQTLRLKARMESTRRRRQHQSLMQLQALLDDVRPPPDVAGGQTLLSRHLGVVDEGSTDPNNAADEPDAGMRLATRLRCFWAVNLAPRWQLGAEVARALAAIGLLSEASTLFQELQLWEEYVLAMVSMGHVESAEKKVREQLEVAPSANMWMYLADLTNELEHYQTAWDLSHGTCSRAKFKLGSAAMQAEKWEEACEHLQEALRVKRHYAEAWYCIATCQIKLDQHEKAMTHFRNVVALDPTHFQAWSSLGGLFARSRMKREALYAFREACRLRGNAWQLWQHVALAALDLGFFQEAIYSATRSLGLGGPPAPQISSLIAQASVKDIRGNDGSSQKMLLPKVRALLQTSCNAMPTADVHWEARLHLEKHYGTKADVRSCMQARMEAYQRNSAWKTEPAALAEFSELVAQLVEDVVDGGEPTDMRQVMRLVETVLHAAEDRLAATEGCEALRMLKAKLVRHIDD